MQGISQLVRKAPDKVPTALGPVTRRRQALNRANDDMRILKRRHKLRLARNPDVSLAILCGNKIGIAGRIAELAAKAIDQEIDAALADIRAFTRNPVEQLIATNHQTRPVARGVQNSPLGPRKSNVAGFIQGIGARKIRRKQPAAKSITFVFRHSAPNRPNKIWAKLL